MELDRKFQMAATCRSVTIGHLQPDQHFPFIHAERLYTRYGHSVLLTVMDSPTTTVKLFLVMLYVDVASDGDTDDINSQRVFLYLIYKETCAMSIACFLEIQKQGQ